MSPEVVLAVPSGRFCRGSPTLRVLPRFISVRIKSSRQSGECLKIASKERFPVGWDFRKHTSPVANASIINVTSPCATRSTLRVFGGSTTSTGRIEPVGLLSGACGIISRKHQESKHAISSIVKNVSFGYLGVNFCNQWRIGASGAAQIVSKRRENGGGSHHHQQFSAHPTILEVFLTRVI